MKIVIYTYFMHQGTERLMPWRTLVEVAKTMNNTQGLEATIVSSSNINIAMRREYQSIEIVEIPKGIKSFNSFFNNLFVLDISSALSLYSFVLRLA